MTNPPPTLLTLPIELRSTIFSLAIRDTPTVRDPESPDRFSLNLSLLSTNRQIYYETRAIPISLHYFGNSYSPETNFLASLPFRPNPQPFQIASLKTLAIEYLCPSDLTHFLALGKTNGYIFGDNTLNLDVLMIHADDWIGGGARRWRYAASRGDIHYDLPRSSRWLKEICGLKGWKQLQIWFREMVNEYWERGSFIQSLFDDFRSHSAGSSSSLDEPFTIWHESRDRPDEKISVFRTKELGRVQSRQWWKRDVGRLMEGKECVVDTSEDINEEEGERSAFHVEERCGTPGMGMRKNYCPNCQQNPGVRLL